MTGTRTPVLTIRDPRVARLFSNEPKLRILLSFALEPRSISEVASALGQPVAKIFYHVTAFVRQGLLKVAREEKRSGKPVKYYESVAQSFFLPEAVIERPCTQGLAEELRQTLDSSMAEAAIEGVLFSADENSQIKMSLSSKQGRLLSPAGEVWHMMKLSDQAAADLARDLTALIERYDRLSGSGKEFLVHAALAPRRPG